MAISYSFEGNSYHVQVARIEIDLINHGIHVVVNKTNTATFQQEEVDLIIAGEQFNMLASEPVTDPSNLYNAVKRAVWDWIKTHEKAEVVFGRPYMEADDVVPEWTDA